MPRALQVPNLPQNHVQTVLIGKPYAKELSGELSLLGITCLTVPSVGELAAPIRGHTDMIAHHLGGNDILLCKNLITQDCKALEVYSPQGETSDIYCSKAKELYCNKFKVVYGEKGLESEYPFNISYNLLRMGNVAFHSKKHTDQTLLRELNDKNIKIVPVRQGYSKCAVCIVDEKSAITSDKGMYCALREHQIECLLIEQGYIDLPGYDSGMIGGATGLIGKNTLAFTGYIAAHPDFERIQRFLDSRSIKPVYLTDRKIFDVGSIIPLEESEQDG